MPVQGIIHGATDFELHLLWTRRAPDADARVRARLPAEVAALGLPPAALERLHPARPWKVFPRRFTVDLPGDVIYRTHGAGGQGPVVPASLGPLADPALAPVTVLMAKLRDERGDIVGQAGAARIDGPAGPAEVDGAVPPGPEAPAAGRRAVDAAVAGGGDHLRAAAGGSGAADAAGSATGGRGHPFLRWRARASCSGERVCTRTPPAC